MSIQKRIDGKVEYGTEEEEKRKMINSLTCSTFGWSERCSRGACARITPRGARSTQLTWSHKRLRMQIGCRINVIAQFEHTLNRVAVRARSRQRDRLTPLASSITEHEN